jgi:hypothetical protein
MTELEELVAQLTDSDPAVRIEAVASLEQLALSEDETEAAPAVMALARVGKEVGPMLLNLLAAGTAASLRASLAEHLLLLPDVEPIADAVRSLIRSEENDKVRFWLAVALNRVGDNAPLQRELRIGRIPEELQAIIREGPGGRLTVLPRLTPIEIVEEPVGEMYVGAEPDEVPAEEVETYAVDEDSDDDLITLSRPPEGGLYEVRGGGGGGGDVEMPMAADDSEETPAPRPRYFEALAPNAVKLGETIGVQVRMALEQTTGAVAKAVTLDVPAEGLTLSVTTHLPGFQLVGGAQFHELLVPAGDDSEWILFRLRAMNEGLHELIFSAFHPEGRLVAELVIQISVDALQETTSTSEVRASAGAIEGDPGEVSLLVDWLPAQESYRFMLVDRSLPDEVISERLKRTPREIVESLVAELEVLARNTPEAGQTTRERLRDRGIQLWTEFIPEALKAQFWERQPHIKSLRIFARDDPVPWELLYPLAQGHDAGFLVEQFPVVRSIRGVQPVSRIGPGSLETVVPAINAPSSAQEEIDAVKACWSSRSGGPLLSDLASLRKVLEGGSFGILHLACHNAFDPADANRSTISFRDQTFAPPVLAPMVATRLFAGSAPLIFMNACRSAGEAPLYTALSGWASSFVGAGAAAFVGSHWSVRDGSSKAFAEIFYAELAAGSNLADSLMAARTGISNDDDPTWLAYTAYGDPRTTI